MGLPELLRLIKCGTQSFSGFQDILSKNGSAKLGEPYVKECHPENEQTLYRLKLNLNITRQEVAADSEDVTKKFNAVHPPSQRVTEGWIFKVVTGIDAGRQYIATTSLVKIGRKSDNHIYLKDPKVSRYHATIKLHGDHLFIKDLGSTNGTRVNGSKVYGERELFAGELIQLGDTVIQLERVSFYTSDAL